MGGLLQNTVFGNSNKPNTFIGGVSATINTPVLIAEKLGISSSRIKNFKIKEADIEFTITGGTYEIVKNAFSGNSSITYYNDSLGLVKTLNVSFQNCNKLTNISFPGLTSINGNYAFSGCSSVTAFNFPNLTSINGNYTFANNTSLIELTAPNLVLSVSNKFVFLGSNNLNILNIEKPTGIGDSSFSNTKITSIDLSNCTILEGNAFSQCVLLKNITNMNLVTTIGVNAFYNCSSLLNFSANSLLTINQQSFFNCTSLTNISFPGLTSINGNYAFSGCSSVTAFNFPNLTSINGNYTFANNTSLVELTAPNLVLSVSNKFVFLGSNNLNILNIEKPTGIGDSSFSNTKITSIDLSNCTILEGNAFSQCVLLKNITNMNLVTTIGVNAFYNCSSLLNFSANSLLTINQQSFFNCTSLTNISFPGLTSINGNYAFSGCSSVTAFNFPNLTSINGNYAFANNTSLIELTAPSLLNLGLSTNENFIFYLIKTGSTITVPIVLKTANAGQPDGDLVYASTARGANIIYVAA
ncbi:leucine-rich repeat domain-containing protein [Flavobacterium defluvii]|uniref:Leucine rich repeat-containing protein n=1 Tax=Flavobacterium defluvii TaxID=370979 RepID=A0A1M5RMN9_9FLAO|nr:leucine-rich repeat domain-containing protein [Flavobacterium defluvii]SHH27567.1 Leucine rich repeat-containing protein [Flavobacterium defluvii]